MSSSRQFAGHSSSASAGLHDLRVCGIRADVIQFASASGGRALAAARHRMRRRTHPHRSAAARCSTACCLRATEIRRPAPAPCCRSPPSPGLQSSIFCAPPSRRPSLCALARVRLEEDRSGAVVTDESASIEPDSRAVARVRKAARWRYLRRVAFRFAVAPARSRARARRRSVPHARLGRDPSSSEFPHHWLWTGQAGRSRVLARAAGCREIVSFVSRCAPRSRAASDGPVVFFARESRAIARDDTVVQPCPLSRTGFRLLVRMKRAGNPRAQGPAARPAVRAR